MRPLRRTNLQLVHIFFTLARTFILISICYPAAQSIRRKFDRDAVANHDLDVVHAHLASQIGQHLSAVFQLHLKGGIGKGFDNDAVLLFFFEV